MTERAPSANDVAKLVREEYALATEIDRVLTHGHPAPEVRRYIRAAAALAAYYVNRAKRRA